MSHVRMIASIAAASADRFVIHGVRDCVQLSTTRRESDVRVSEVVLSSVFRFGGRSVHSAADLTTRNFPADPVARPQR